MPEAREHRGPQRDPAHRYDEGSALRPRDAEIAFGGARIASAVARTLSTPKLDSHNSFEAPDAVPSPQERTVSVGSPFVFTFPPASVTKLRVTMA